MVFLRKYQKRGLMKLFYLISLFLLSASVCFAGEWGSFNGTIINYKTVKTVQNNCTALIPRIDIYTTGGKVQRIKYPAYLYCQNGYVSILEWMSKNGK